MKAYFLRFLLSLSFTMLTQWIEIYAQSDLGFFDNNRKMVFGGSLGLQFGTQTIMDVSPMIAFRPGNRFMVGVSPTYKYYSYIPYNNSGRYRSNVLGGGLFARYYIIEQLFTHCEYEFLHYRSFDGISMNYNDYKSLLVGGGYMQRIGARSYYSVSILWNLNDTYNSIYNNPVIRFGYLF